MIASANRSLVQLACMAVVGATLGACGGGGGSGTGEVAASPATLVITSANRDTVGHFGAIAALSLPISWLSDSSVSLVGGPAQSASLANRSALLQAVRNRFSGAAGRSQPLAFMDTGDLPCNFGGTVSATIDDRDNSGMESPGDVETIQFNNCMGSVNETYNGSMRIDVAEVAAQSLTYNATLAQLSYVTPAHSLTFNGSYVANESMTAASVQTTTLSVVGSVTVVAMTHAPYSDTVTLANGFVVQDQIDYAAGRSVLWAQGRVESAFAAGSVDVSTAQTLRTATTGIGVYPNEGVLKVAGKVGALWITVRSSASVCLDADINDDGAIESTNTQSWDWLV